MRDYEDASERNTGFKGLGSQSWGLIPRIRQVSVFLDQVPEARATVYEIHPEVCFAKLNTRDDPLPSKSSEEGLSERLSERLSVLTQLHAGPDHHAFGTAVKDFVEDRMKNAAWHHRIRSGRIDDVVDAAVLALTAKLVAENGCSMFPTGRDVDDPPVTVHPGASW